MKNLNNQKPTNKSGEINFVGLQSTLRNPEISKTAKLLLVDLLLYAGTNTIAFPSRETLSTNHSITQRYVDMKLKELKKYNLIAWERGKGPGNSNRYSFNDVVYLLKNTNRETGFHNRGNLFRHKPGSLVPTKEIIESNNKYNFKKFEACNKNGCKDGYIITEGNAAVKYCECRLKHENTNPNFDYG